MRYMKAALLRSPGHLTVDEVPVPSCPESGILVEVKACAICTSDAKMAKSGHPALIYPRILGHEVSGVVTESRSLEIREGKRVQIFPGLRCKKCIACLRGADNHCKDIEILGFSCQGGMAEFLTVPFDGSLCGAVNVIPEGVGFEEAALTEPLACCLNAQERSPVIPGDTVLIIGAGPMGLLNAMLARTRGAKKVFLADVFKNRRKTAGLAGPDLVIDPHPEEMGRIIEEETEGWGVDVIILASSEVLPDSSLLKILAPRGRICLFSGLSPEKGGITYFDFNSLHYREVCIAGAYGCTIAQNEEALGLIASGIIKVSKIITKTISLDRIEEGIDYVVENKGMKVIVTKF